MVLEFNAKDFESILLHLIQAPSAKWQWAIHGFVATVLIPVCLVCMNPIIAFYLEHED
jgi:hypothetical protein